MNKKLWLRLICFFIAFLIPAAVALTALLALPKAYGDTFLGELKDKYALLRDTDEKKIVVIGGSSVAFGLDSAKIEEATGYKVVNFGLYATLGTKIMLDLSHVNINKGDIVILAPELDSQTLSLYFNAESAWQGLEGDFSMLFRVGNDNYGDLLAELPHYLSKTVEYAKQGKTINPTGIYRHDSFNEYGDISYTREKNTMPRGVDRTKMISLTPDIFDSEFVDYVNKYIRFAKRHGASVYFSYCPMNEAAMDSSTTDESKKAFTDFIAENINCDIIGDINDSIMSRDLFFDTNFHLNDAGVQEHTARLIDEIKKVIG